MTRSFLVMLLVAGCATNPETSDADGDGFAADVDCDDRNDRVNPSAAEVCNGIDDDCDGSTDDASAVDAGGWFIDADGDGFGGEEIPLCDGTNVEDVVAQGGDCDDDDATVTGPQLLYADTDGDGFGSAAAPAVECRGTTGFSTNDRDCDDTRSDISPAALEVCDDLDNDCDAAVDEDAVDAESLFIDGDLDTYGDPDRPVLTCPDAGFVETAGDCNDASDVIHVGATELCGDGIDNNCDQRIDEPRGWMAFGITAGAAGSGSTTMALPLGAQTVRVTYAPVDSACVLTRWSEGDAWSAPGTLVSDAGATVEWTSDLTYVALSDCVSTVAGSIDIDFDTRADTTQAPGWRWVVGVALGGSLSLDSGGAAEGPTTITSSAILERIGTHDPGMTGAFATLSGGTTITAGADGGEDGITFFMLPADATSVRLTYDDGGNLDPQVLMVGVIAPSACVTP